MMAARTDPNVAPLRPSTAHLGAKVLEHAIPGHSTYGGLMPSPEILPFADEHVAARRRPAGRPAPAPTGAAEPLLSPRYEDPEAARAEVAARVRRRGRVGSVAVVGRPASSGYLLGAPKAGSAWGAQRLGGGGRPRGRGGRRRPAPSTAVAATRWVEEGRTAHYALLPAYDTALIGAWFRLAFGHQHTHAIREPAAAGPVRGGPRRAAAGTRGDPGAGPARHGARPTTRRSRRRSPRACPTSTRSGWRTGRRTSTTRSSGTSSPSTTARSSAAPWAARWRCRRATPGPPGPTARRSWVSPPSSPRPAGSAPAGLSARRCRPGRSSEGYPSIVTDWRETNLLSSRAWRGLGYRDTFTRVHRLVGH